MDKTDFNGEKIMANEKILKEADNYFTETLHKLGTCDAFYRRTCTG